MATSLKRYRGVFLSFLLVGLFVAVIMYVAANPVPQTEQQLNCRPDSPRVALSVHATVYDGTLDWSTIVGPQQTKGELPAGTSVCLVSFDDWNPAYVQVVYPDPQGEGRDDQYVRGWVEVGTLPAEVAQMSLSINSPWESSVYP